MKRCGLAALASFLVLSACACSETQPIVEPSDAGHDSGAAGAGGQAGAAGSAGEAGRGGGGGSLPCDGACGGETPVCQDSTQVCVECTEPGHCSGATPRCDEASNTCVQCLEPAHCTTVTNSRCDSGTCRACVTNDDCAHLAGTGVCDGGTCVQCTAADESACGANSCNPATKQCTTTPRGSLDSCMACVADTECIGGDQPDPERRCIPMLFGEQPRPGGYCLRRVAKTCPESEPYRVVLNAVSLSGASDEAYCGIEQARVTCEAVRDLLASQRCSDGLDSQCGCVRDGDGTCVEPGKGGLCRRVGPDANSCTYVCGRANQCPAGTTCGPDGYCQ